MTISINKLTRGLNINHRKESKFSSSYTIVAMTEKGFGQPLSVRFYWTGQTCYCCVWGSVNDEGFNGSGKAAGWGYDKQSAALSMALTSAGFEVSGLSASGNTEGAIDRVAVDIMGIDPKNYTVVYAHG